MRPDFVAVIFVSSGSGADDCFVDGLLHCDTTTLARLRQAGESLS